MLPPPVSAAGPWRTYLNIVPLQSQARSVDLLDGSAAQLSRASDYGSEGYRFESYPSHFPAVAQTVSECGGPYFGPVAQLNRASDYGSEGYRFESYPGHFLRI